MTCEETLNSDCILRHKKQDECNSKIDQMFEIICGGLEPENSMKTKVDTLYKERAEIKKIFIANLTMLIAIVFWCGYQYAVLDSHTAKIAELEKKMDSIVFNCTEDKK